MNQQRKKKYLVSSTTATVATPAGNQINNVKQNRLPSNNAYQPLDQPIIPSISKPQHRRPEWQYSMDPRRSSNPNIDSQVQLTTQGPLITHGTLGDDAEDYQLGYDGKNRRPSHTGGLVSQMQRFETEKWSSNQKFYDSSSNQMAMFGGQDLLRSKQSQNKSSSEQS